MPWYSTGLKLARAAYTAAVYPAGPDPIIKQCTFSTAFVSIIPIQLKWTKIKDLGQFQSFSDSVLPRRGREAEGRREKTLSESPRLRAAAVQSLMFYLGIINDLNCAA